MNQYCKISFKCHKSYKKEFPNSRCLLIISVGQKVHEGEKLSSTIKLINNSFKSCTIQVDDSLQRYNFEASDKLSPQNAYQKAVELGYQWLQRNQPIYSELTIPHKIITWDKWINHPNYKKIKKIIDNFFQVDLSFQNAVHNSINHFLERYQKRIAHKKIDHQLWYQVCLKYLLEECAAMCLWPEEKCEFEIYPSGRNAAQIVTYEKFIKPYYPHLLKSVSLYFENRRSLE